MTVRLGLDVLNGQGEHGMRPRGLSVRSGGLDSPGMHARAQVQQRLLGRPHGRLGEVGDLDEASALVLQDAAGASAAVLLEQVADHLVVDLQEGDLHFERAIGLGLPVAVGVHGVEDLRDGTEDETSVLPLAVAEHGVGLPRARRAVDEDCGTPALRHRVGDERRATPRVHLVLRGRRAEDVVEHALLHAALLRPQELVPARGGVLADGYGAHARDLDDSVFPLGQRPHAHGNTNVLAASDLGHGGTCNVREVCRALRACEAHG
mmetsp:Transcript_90380/g.264447  ORF Transcript_90380/g.264447 Transcript_90380/m.264447 type:complete len:264 (+) Transcript_90380:1218-2009(+)